MKTNLKKLLFVVAFLISGAPALMTSLLSTSDIESEFIFVSSAYADTYKGPLCQGSSGSYCCKDSSGSCAAGASCTSCKASNEQ